MGATARPLCSNVPKSGRTPSTPELGKSTRDIAWDFRQSSNYPGPQKIRAALPPSQGCMRGQTVSSPQVGCSGDM